MSDSISTGSEKEKPQGVGNIMLNLSGMFHHFFGENTYFISLLEKRFGSQRAKILIKLILAGSISKGDYEILQKKKCTFSGMKEIDMSILNSLSPIVFTTESLQIFLEELEISIQTKLTEYRIYEILETPDFFKNIQVLASGGNFKVLFDSENDIFYLDINGKIYLEKELLWEQDGDTASLKHIIFTGDETTFVYSFENKILDTFPYELKDIFDIGEETYLLMTGKDKTLLYILKNGFCIQGNFIYNTFLEIGDDILFVTTNYKVNKSGKTKPFIEIFSKNSANKVLDIQGKLLQTLEHDTGIYICYESEDFIESEKGVQSVYHLVCEQIEESGEGYYHSRIVLKTLHRIQNHTKPEERESLSRMKIDIFQTKDEIFARITYFAGNIERDTPIYDFVSLSGNQAVKGISKIFQFVHTDYGIYIEYSDIKGQKQIFDSGKKYQKYLQ